MSNISLEIAMDNLKVAISTGAERVEVSIEHIERKWDELRRKGEWNAAERRRLKGENIRLLFNTTHVVD